MTVLIEQPDEFSLSLTKVWRDEDLYEFEATVKSSGFSGIGAFYVGEQELDNFAVELESFEKTLQGNPTLCCGFSGKSIETSFSISLGFNGKNKVLVTGLLTDVQLCEHSPFHSLHFRGEVEPSHLSGIAARLRQLK